MTKRVASALGGIGVVAAGAIVWAAYARRCPPRPPLEELGVDDRLFLPFLGLSRWDLVDELSPGAYTLDIRGRCYSSRCQITISASIPATDEWLHCEGGDTEFQLFGVEGMAPKKMAILVPPEPRWTLSLSRDGRVLAERDYVRDPDRHYRPADLKAESQ